jgi:fused signal recognition particle receptor
LLHDVLPAADRELALWLLLALALLGAGVVVVRFALARRKRKTGWLAAPPGEDVARPPVAVSPATAADKLRSGLARTRAALAGRLGSIVGGADRNSDDFLAQLEEALIESDVGVRSTERLLAAVKNLASPARSADGIRVALHDEVRRLLATPDENDRQPTAKPWVVLVVGVNGVGKTTTIAKLAALHRAFGRQVMMVAADTFRAAAIDQLAVWAERTGSQIVQQAPGTDPSAVVFDGVRAALARGSDVVLVDTAGRLHTKVNLMEELRKVRRVIAREVPGAPHEVLLVLDATTGQNAVAQARTFLDAVEVSGVILTKLDGTAKGGVVIAIRHELGLPVRYVGVGESLSDLQPFDAELFADSLFAEA